MKIKNGFSLMEVMLVLGIIAVVIAMGFSISKKGMENAYNLYWYTGYKALADSIYDYNYKNPGTTPTALLYAQHMYDLVRSTTGTPSGSTPNFTAPNGIKYTFNTVGSFIRIDMEIPTYKQRTGNAINKTAFIYFPDDTVPMVYPANTSSLGTDYLNLRTRADILPFIRRGGNTDNDRRTLYSFQGGYCKINGSPGFTASPSYASISGCSGSADGGVLIPVNPRKAY